MERNTSIDAGLLLIRLMLAVVFLYHGGQKLFQALFNIAEYQSTKGRDGFGWDGEAWYGGDTERLWVKSAGEGSFGERLESAEAQALYSYAIGPYFWVQGGLRYDFEPDPSRVYATVALEGLAPSFFDVEAALSQGHAARGAAGLGVAHVVLEGASVHATVVWLLLAGR